MGVAGVADLPVLYLSYDSHNFLMFFSATPCHLAWSHRPWAMAVLHHKRWNPALHDRVWDLV